MNGSVVFSNDAPPPSLANATSSTATRPSSLAAGGSVRGVRNAKRGRVAGGLSAKAKEDSRLFRVSEGELCLPELVAGGVGHYEGPITIGARAKEIIGRIGRCPAPPCRNWEQCSRCRSAGRS